MNEVPRTALVTGASSGVGFEVARWRPAIFAPADGSNRPRPSCDTTMRMFSAAIMG